MEQEQSQKFHWLDIAETVSVVGSVGGAVASLISQQFAFVSIPLSLSVALNMVNRRRLLNLINHNHNHRISYLAGTIEEHKDTVSEVIETKFNQQETNLNHLAEKLTASIDALNSDLNQKTHQLQEQNNDLGYQQQQIEEIVGELKQIENCSQAIRANPNSAPFYYQRGVSHQRLGDKQGAIEDYTTAINLESNYASAYHNRGILKAELGDKKQAVEDLRKAAKFYFEQGDIDSYQQAKELGKSLHDLQSLDYSKYEPLQIGNVFN